MRTVRYHEDARLELLHEVGFYSAISRQLGERFDKAVEQVEAFASRSPVSGIRGSLQIRHTADVDEEISVFGHLCHA